MCKDFAYKATAAAAATATPTKRNAVSTAVASASSLFVKHKRPLSIIAGLFLAFVACLISLYMFSRGFRRTVDFWADLSPLVVRYKLLKYKARYVDGLDDDSLVLKRRIQAFNQDIAPQLASKMLQMGGIFVKLGQVLSTMGAGILDDAFVQALKPLQNGFPPETTAKSPASSKALHTKR